jgi:hypothetical protein
VPSATVSGLATKPCEKRDGNRSGTPLEICNRDKGERGADRGAHVGVVLPPGLALLGEAAARDSPGRHGETSCGGGGGDCSALGLFARGGGSEVKRVRSVVPSFVYLTPPRFFRIDEKKWENLRYLFLCY